MLFFGFLVVGALVAALVGWLFGIRALMEQAACMRWGMSAALLFFGVDHLLVPERYIPMVPEVLARPDLIVLFTGLCEIAGAIGLLLPRTRRLAGALLAVYFVCVFPANIRNAVEGLSVSGLPGASWYYWVRLAFQPVAVWWALRASGILPGRRRREQQAPAS